MIDPERLTTKTDAELDQYRDAARLLRDSEITAGAMAWGPTSLSALVLKINNELHLRDVARREATTTARDAEVDAIAAGGEAR